LASDTGGNTVGCREYHANFAATMVTTTYLHFPRNLTINITIPLIIIITFINRAWSLRSKAATAPTPAPLVLLSLSNLSL
jgi:hypothetical protein